MNPTAGFEDANILDQSGLSMSTNDTRDAGNIADETGEKNSAPNASGLSNSGASHRHFMCLPNGGSRGADREVDSAADAMADPSQSSMGSVPSGPTLLPHGSDLAGSSAATPTPTPPASPLVESQGDPVEGGSGVLSPGSPASSGSLSLPVATAAPAPPTRPSTRLQHGIVKPKVYTDGTVRWGMLGAIVPDEPRTVEEVFQDKRWVAAMDSEYEALMKNKTWHLVPYQKGKNVMGV